MVDKGCQKRIIMLKSTGSELFDEAYFILKERAEKSAHITETDMVKEANRIISENILGVCRGIGRGIGHGIGHGIGGAGGRSGGLFYKLKWYAAGALSCGAVIGIVSFFANM